MKSTLVEIMPEPRTQVSQHAWDWCLPVSRLPRLYLVCTRCVMDTTDPDISFDQQGVCTHCHDYDNFVRTRVPASSEAQRRLRDIVELIRSEGANKPYDCIIGISGGVDSTFVAQRVKALGLRPLAVHLDNGWDSEAAVSNIAKVLKGLDLDLYTHVIEWEEFKDIQRAFLLASTPDAEIPTDHAIFAILYKQATQRGIRYVITGINVRTETHLPAAWSQGHWDWGYIRAVHRQFGTGRIKTFPHFNFYNFVTSNRYSHTTLNLLDLLDYSKKGAVTSLERDFGWKDYGGKHNESIYTRWFQGFYLPRKFGFDKRRCHLSSRVCSGELSRSEALTELRSPPYPLEQQTADCEYVAKKLGFSHMEFGAIMDAPPRTMNEFPSYARFMKGKTFQNALGIWQLLKYGPMRAKRAA